MYVGRGVVAFLLDKKGFTYIVTDSFKRFFTLSSLLQKNYRKMEMFYLDITSINFY